MNKKMCVMLSKEFYVAQRLHSSLDFFSMWQCPTLHFSVGRKRKVFILPAHTGLPIKARLGYNLGRTTQRPTPFMV